ncbi:MAG TPA: 50S ribosomal protein L4, partial [Thermoanaerobaculia bacterium]|nr:50S ribosomal protein L4 [Thermoanaerobaculia bacterium]
MSMASIPVWNWKKEQVGELPVPAGVFDYPYRKHLVWEVVKAHLAGARAGTHKTKVRSEVSGSG